MADGFVSLLFVACCVCIATRVGGSDVNTTDDSTQQPVQKPDWQDFDTVQPPSDDPNIGIFLQITDIHYDSNYSIHGDIDHMCHPFVENATTTKPPSVLSRFGYYSCDAPWDLVYSSIQASKALTDKPDFIVWTGDTIAHVSASELNYEKVFSLIANVTDLLLETFPNVTILPTIGNHDSWPQDQVPEAPNVYYPGILHKSHWDRMLSKKQQASFLKGGYYIAQLTPKLVMLGINTIVWYIPDNMVWANHTDPDNQFQWLETHLDECRKNGQKAYISGHVAPGAMYNLTIRLRKDFNDRFVGILREYRDVVAAVFYGHEHRDEFRIVYTDSREPAVPIILPAAVTPWNYGNNPTTRLYYYDKTTGRILNYNQYYMNLTDVILTGQPKWQLEYTFNEAYGVKDVTASSMHEIASKFSDKSDSALQTYFTYYSASYITDFNKCGDECRHAFYCSVTQVGYCDYHHCMAAVFSDMVSYLTHDRYDCGGPVNVGIQCSAGSSSCVNEPSLIKSSPSNIAPIFIGALLALAILGIVSLFTYKWHKTQREAAGPSYTLLQNT